MSLRTEGKSKRASKVADYREDEQQTQDVTHGLPAMQIGCSVRNTSALDKTDRAQVNKSLFPYFPYLKKP